MSELHCIDGKGFIALPGYDYDRTWQFAAARRLTQELEPRHVGQVEVQQHTVGILSRSAARPVTPSFACTISNAPGTCRVSNLL